MLFNLSTEQAYNGSIVVEAELLDRFVTDPPDVPVLADVLMLLQLLVNSGQFHVSRAHKCIHLYAHIQHTHKHTTRTHAHTHTTHTTRMHTHTTTQHTHNTHNTHTHNTHIHTQIVRYVPTNSCTHYIIIFITP